MDTVINLSPEDRSLVSDLIRELRRYNDASANRDRLMTCTEAAEYIGVSKRTISQMISDKRLHKVMRGGRKGILLSELNETR